MSDCVRVNDSSHYLHWRNKGASLAAFQSSFVGIVGAELHCCRNEREEKLNMHVSPGLMWVLT